MAESKLRISFNAPGKYPACLLALGLSLAVAGFAAGAIQEESSQQTPAKQLPANESPEPDSAETRRPESELSNDELTLTRDELGIVVAIGDQPFTCFDHTSYDKPVLYPVYGPGQIPMTRHFPMQEIAGEQTDHPHHKSIWTGHEINHVDFWSERSGSVKVQEIEVDEQQNLFRTHSNWIDKSDDSIVLSDSAVYQFGYDDQTRWIDVTQTMIASHGEIRFADTKEGFFAIRVHPKLRLVGAPDDGVNDVTGRITNSAGQTDAECWGQPAAWVDYSGLIDGNEVGIAMFDHPSNFRHPTTWHARDYGLLAANPFGLHHFTGAEPGTGELKLEAEQQLKLRYRIVFHTDDCVAAEVTRRYAEWAAAAGEVQSESPTADVGNL